MKNDSISIILTMRDIVTVILEQINIFTGSSQQRQLPTPTKIFKHGNYKRLKQGINKQTIARRKNCRKSHTFNILI
jgi:hypothetical protein